jgi:hypothetical protein
MHHPDVRQTPIPQSPLHRERLTPHNAVYIGLVSPKALRMAWRFNMRRLIKSLFWWLAMALHGAAVLATVVVWVCSHVAPERYSWFSVVEQPTHFESRRLSILNSRGAVQFARVDYSTDSPVRIAQRRGSRRPDLGFSRIRDHSNPIFGADQSILADLGFQLYTNAESDDAAQRTDRGLTVPYWAIFLLLVGYPLWRYIARVVRHQREDRLAMGLCPTCGEPIDAQTARCRICNKPTVLV